MCHDDICLIPPQLASPAGARRIPSCRSAAPAAGGAASAHGAAAEPAARPGRAGGTAKRAAGEAAPPTCAPLSAVSTTAAALRGLSHCCFTPVTMAFDQALFADWLMVTSPLSEVEECCALLLVAMHRTMVSSILTDRHPPPPPPPAAAAGPAPGLHRRCDGGAGSRRATSAAGPGPGLDCQRTGDPDGLQSGARRRCVAACQLARLGWWARWVLLLPPQQQPCLVQQQPCLVQHAKGMLLNGPPFPPLPFLATAGASSGQVPVQRGEWLSSAVLDRLTAGELLQAAGAARSTEASEQLGKLHLDLGLLLSRLLQVGPSPRAAHSPSNTHASCPCWQRCPSQTCLACTLAFVSTGQCTASACPSPPAYISPPPPPTAPHSPPPPAHTHTHTPH